MTDSTAVPTAASTGTTSPAANRAIATIDLMAKAVAAYKRNDLLLRVQGIRDRITDPAFHVLVVGEFKQGKSSLVNALLGQNVCPVDDDIATAVPTAVRWAPAPEAAVLLERATDPAAGGMGNADIDEPRRLPIAVDDVPRWVVESHGQAAAHGERIRSVDVGMPLPMLQEGLVLVDTPGVGGLGSTHGTATMGALPLADAVLFVTDASQELTAPEVEFLRHARQMCPNVVMVLTKTDFYPEWRRIKELDEGHLQRLGLSAPIVPVSSTLHGHAVRLGDANLDTESGFPRLLEHLRNDVVGRSEDLVLKVARSELLDVVGQLGAQFQTEKQALDNPVDAARLVTELEAAREKAMLLKTLSARWQQTLNDGVTDLTAEVDHDLRTRIRRITQQADEAIEKGDPAEMWPEFEPWLYRRCAQDVVYNYQLLQQQAGHLSRRVAEHFRIDTQDVVVAPEVQNPTTALANVAVEAAVDLKTMGRGQKVMNVVRGGYIGTLMFGFIGSMAGIALGPLPIVVGLFMGRKQLKDEKERLLANRRLQARNAHRKYTDEITFMVTKDSRDTLRLVQRQLRDFYQTRAEELQKSTADTLAAAQQANKSDQATKDKRLRDVDAEITRIEGLGKRVAAIGTVQLPPPSAAAKKAAATAPKG
jgi:hypothetical protein